MKKNSKKKVSVKEFSMSEVEHIGIDLGDRFCYACCLSASGEILGRLRIATDRLSFEDCFGRLKPVSIYLEVGTHSPWISRLLESLGHRVVVANANRVKALHKSLYKNDKRDAEFLARIGRADRQLLAPIRHRGERAQAHRAIVNARSNLVECRTALISCVRGTVKSFGARLPSSSSSCFVDKVTPHVPAVLKPALQPLLKTIERLTSEIKAYDKKLNKLAREQYPETELIQQVAGVGPLTSLAYILTVETPERFEKSRHAGAYLGLVPRQYASGDSDPQLRITRAGDVYLRKLLVQCAHYIMGPFGPDSDLKRHGEKIAARGGKNAKKRAAVAVARKLSVLLHRLWISGEEYRPLYNEEQREAA